PPARGGGRPGGGPGRRCRPARGPGPGPGCGVEPRAATAAPVPARRPPSRPARELVERRSALLEEGLLALLRLLAQVVEEGGVAGQLLDPGQAVVGRVQRRLQHPQRERAVLEHAATPRHRLLLELLERDDRVDEPE